MERAVAIDFETTGLSATSGDRVIEVGAVEIVDGLLGGRFTSLVNPDVRVPPFITELTGISDSMVRQAPPSRRVMRDLREFIGDATLVAHNAHFDHGFFRSEMARHRLPTQSSFLCTVRIARRVYPRAPSYRLKAIAEYADVQNVGVFHRALADAMVTAKLFTTICEDIQGRHRIREISLSLLSSLQTVVIADADAWLARKVRRS